LLIVRGSPEEVFLQLFSIAIHKDYPEVTRVLLYSPNNILYRNGKIEAIIDHIKTNIQISSDMKKVIEQYKHRLHTNTRRSLTTAFDSAWELNQAATGYSPEKASCKRQKLTHKVDL